MISDGKRWVIVAIAVAIITCGMWYWVRGERIFGANFVPGIGEAAISEIPGMLPDLSIKSGKGHASVEPGGSLPDYRPTLTRGYYSTQI